MTASTLPLKLDGDTFTIAMDDLIRFGVVWYAEQGIFIALSEGGKSFAAYRESVKTQRLVRQAVACRPEHSFAAAFHGQPRPHAVHAHVGVKHARQRFLLEANGDIVLDTRCVASLNGLSTTRARFRNRGHGRFFFGLE